MASVLKIGSTGKEVVLMQCYLVAASLGELKMDIDGVFGFTTEKAVKAFQQISNLQADGIVGQKTIDALKKEVETKQGKFMVSIHGGHGGYAADGTTYCVPDSVGKKYQHAGIELHSKDGWFYEGVENLLIAEAVAKELRKQGIFVLVTHKPNFCDYGRLGIHAVQTAPFIKNGFFGYTHSFHSNAAPTKYKDKNQVEKRRTQQELDNIVGGWVFTGKGNTISDKISAIHLQNWQSAFGDWVRLQDDAKMAGVGSDKEDNFQVLREIEEMAIPDFGAFLEECGFMTSKKDCRLITSADFRTKRINAAVQTAIRSKKEIFKISQ